MKNREKLHIILKYTRIIIACIAGAFANVAFWDYINMDSNRWLYALGFGLFYGVFFVLIVIIPDKIIERKNKSNDK